MEKVFLGGGHNKGKDPGEEAYWACSRIVGASKQRMAGNRREGDPCALSEMIQHWSVLSRGVARSDMGFNWNTRTVMQRIHFRGYIS